jgi:excisionase family DNA binding protein
MDTPTLLDTREAAALLQVHPRTVKRAASDGVLRPIRLRRDSPMRFIRREVEALLEPEPATKEAP